MEITENKLFNLIQICFVTSLLALIAAYSGEYILKLRPCILCIYERIPYFVVIFISGIYIIWYNFFGSQVNSKVKPLILVLCGIAFALNSLISFYHLGVEWKIFKGTEKCQASKAIGYQTVEQIREQILNSIVSCADPSFTFLGISLTGWNLLLSCALTLLITYYLKKYYAK
jgi:disulfide bond formation protein DsbB